MRQAPRQRREQYFAVAQATLLVVWRRSPSRLSALLSGRVGGGLTVFFAGKWMSVCGDEWAGINERLSGTHK